MPRRVANERYSHSDERGCKLSARLILLYIVFGLLLRDRMPGAAQDLHSSIEAGSSTVEWRVPPRVNQR